MNDFDNFVEKLKSGEFLNQSLFDRFASEKYPVDFWASGGGRAYIREVINKELAERSASKATAPKLRMVESIVDRLIKKHGSQLDQVAEPSAETVREAIRQDFRFLATGLLLGVENGCLNWLLLCYRAGYLPYGAVEVPGRLEKMLHVSPKKALQLLEAAQVKSGVTREILTRNAKDRAARIAGARRSQDLLEELGDSTVSTAKVIQEICSLKNPRAKVTTEPTVAVKYGIPTGWLQLLQSQKDGKSPSWDSVWKPASTWFPSLRAFVREKCYGVAIVKEKKTLSLAYVFRLTSGAVIVFKGELPHRISARKGSKTVKLPPEFRAFYEKVHDGFRGGCGGITPFSTGSLDGWMSPKDVFSDPDDPPFSLADIVPVYDQGNGNYICFDATKTTTDKMVGGYFDHELPEDSTFDEDVRESINERFEHLADEYRDNHK